MVYVQYMWCVCTVFVVDYLCTLFYLYLIDKTLKFPGVVRTVSFFNLS